MTDLREFLLAAKRAIIDLDASFPDDITGPVPNPLYRIASQLAVAEAKGKGLTLLRNVLLASAMLLCSSSNFKPIAIDNSDAKDESRAGDLLAEAVGRYICCVLNYLFLQPILFLLRTGMNPEELVHTTKRLQKLRIADAVKPFRLSLMISPVILLSTRLLQNTGYEKQDLVQVNSKNALVLSAAH